MNIGFYVAAAAMRGLERWQENIATNMSAGSTPGYRRRETEFSMAPAGSVTNGPGSVGAVQYPSSRSAVNFQGGQVVGTGREMDVAIQGNGFFEIQMPDGSHAYTRSGGFYMNSERTLVDAAGRPVLGEGGSQVQLLSEGGSLSIARDGTITQGKQPIGKLAIYNFTNAHTLVPLSGGMFAPSPGQEPQQIEQPVLLQGALETSNVQPMEEMVNLVQVSRAYEAAQKIITSRDDLVDKSIRTFT